MGVALYRAGDSHDINGIVCEMQVFDEYSYEHNLKAGWFMNPKDIENAEEEVSERESEEGEKEGGEIEEDEKEGDLKEVLDSMTDDEIREKAKAAAVPSWHLIGIDKLKAKLSGIGE